MESKENVQKGNGLVYFPGPDVPKIFIVQVFAKTLFKLPCLAFYVQVISKKCFLWTTFEVSSKKNLKKIFQEKTWTPKMVFTLTQLKKASDEIQAKVK